MSKLGIINGNDLVLLVHGFTNANETEKLLDFHYRMTPDITVLMIDWRKDLNTIYGGFNNLLYLLRYYRASNFASSYNISDFLLNFKNFRISCIGHSLGSHMCGSICRNIKKFGKWCDRIVGLDVAGPLWGSFYKKYSLNKFDAKYVTFLMTTNQYGLRNEYLAHEFITANIYGNHINECPTQGKFNATVCGFNKFYSYNCIDFSIGTGESSSCAHTMPVLIFAKSLDVRTSLTLISLNSSNNIISSWNGYSMSLDLRYNHIYPNWVVTNESAFIPKDVVMIRLDKSVSNVNSDFGPMILKNNELNEWIIFVTNASLIDEFNFYTKNASVTYLRVFRSRLVAASTWKFVQPFRETKNCYMEKEKVKCTLRNVKENGFLVPRTNLFGFNNECAKPFPFSYLSESHNYTIITSIGKLSLIDVDGIPDYLVENSKIVSFYS